MTKRTISADDLERLNAIKDQIKDLTSEAFELIRGTSETERARSYWYAHILMALDNDNDFVGRGQCTLADTINHLTNEVEEGYREIARGNIERHLDCGEDDSADTIYSEAYTLGFDALHDKGVDVHIARRVADEVARCFAQP